MRKIIQFLLFIGIVAVAVVGAKVMISFKKEPAKVERKAVAPLVKTMVATRDDIQVLVHGYGVVGPKVQVQIVPQVAGQVLSVADEFINGGFFKANQPLVTIDPRDYELILQRRKATVENVSVTLEKELAEAELAKQEWQKFNPGVEPDSPLVYRESQVKTVKAELAAAKAELAIAELNLKRTIISLPFDGRVVNENVDPGQYVAPGQSLGTAYGTAVAEISVPLEDKELQWFDVPLFQQGNGDDDEHIAEAIIETEFAGQHYEWTGTVVRTEGMIDQASRTVSVVVEVQEPFDTSDDSIPLVPGMFVDVNIKGRMLNHVVSIPRHAVHDGDIVYVIKDKKLHIQPVTIARWAKESVYITHGVEHDDVVIISPLDIVSDGMSVRILGDIDEEEAVQEKGANEQGVKEEK